MNNDITRDIMRFFLSYVVRFTHVTDLFQATLGTYNLYAATLKKFLGYLKVS